MTNPPETTNMTAPAKAVKMIKIRATQDIRMTNGMVVKAGGTVEATPEEAEEFCDKSFEGHYGFTGERMKSDGDCDQRKIKRAVRV